MDISGRFDGGAVFYKESWIINVWIFAFIVVQPDFFHFWLIFRMHSFKKGSGYNEFICG